MLAPLGYTGNVALSYGTAIAFCLLAGAGTLGLGNKAREVLQRSVGSAHAAVVRFAILVIGGLATVFFTLELLNIAVTQLIVGGAVTGVLVGIAAQQSLANVFAGMVLLMARPFRVGDQIGDPVRRAVRPARGDGQRGQRHLRPAGDGERSGPHPELPGSGRGGRPSRRGAGTCRAGHTVIRPGIGRPGWVRSGNRRHARGSDGARQQQ